MTIQFQCPDCESWTRTEQVATAGWRCVHCGATIPAAAPTEKSELSECRRCGNHELYVQKAFPHWLGMGIIATASIAFIVTMGLYWIVTAWCILIGSAILDVILYLTMGSVTVCYRCLTQYRGFPPNPAHAPFALAVGEKYRQERLRRQQLRGS